MFRKLITQLPFQPSLLDDLSLYLQRVQKKRQLYIITILLLLLMLVLQVYIYAYPIQSSMQTSISDVVYGATSKESVLRAYESNIDQLGRTDIQSIYDYYGISMLQISQAKYDVLHSKENADYLITTRALHNSPGNYISIKDTVIYETTLDQYSNARNFTYNTLTGVSTFGYRFWILLNGSGAIVFSPGNNSYNVTLNTTFDTSDIVTSQQDLNYYIMLYNNGGFPANDVSITTYIPDGFEYISYTSSRPMRINNSHGTLKWTMAHYDNMPAYGGETHITLKLKPTTSLSRSEKECLRTVAFVPKLGSSTVDERCISVVPHYCPGSGSITTDNPKECQIQCNDGSYASFSQQCKEPVAACEVLFIRNGTAWNNRIFTISSLRQNEDIGYRVTLYINDVITKEFSYLNESTFSFPYTFDKSGKYQVRAEVVSEQGEQQTPYSCPTKEVVITKLQKDTTIPSIVASHVVEDETKNVIDKLRPGQEFSVIIGMTNYGDTAKDITFSGTNAFNVKDILEYATLLDGDGGHLSKSNQSLYWDGEVQLPPHETTTKTVRFKTLAPLPIVPTPSSEPKGYDNNITIHFGYTSQIHLPKNLPKVIEETLSISSDTQKGPFYIAITTLLLVITLFLFARNRLIASELKEIQKDFRSGGL